MYRQVVLRIVTAKAERTRRVMWKAEPTDKFYVLTVMFMTAAAAFINLTFTRAK